MEGQVDSSAAASEQEETSELHYDDKLAALLEFVDLAIDINSVRFFPFGWRVMGRRVKALQRGPAGQFTGRVLAIIGEYKVGKTWLQRMILGTEALDSSEIHTPGICMKFVEKPQKSAPAPSPRGRGARGRGRGRGRGAGGVTATKPQDSSQYSNIDYIVLDSAGTDSACSDSRLKDTRATELVLRKILIAAASKLVYVTNRFNRSTQIAVRAVIDQLRESGNAITTKNRLLVVHNMSDVTSATVLQQRITEVKEVYDPAEKDEWEEDSVEENDSDVPAWMEVTKDVTITGAEGGSKTLSYKYFNARRTTHVFLVHHDLAKADGEDPNWRVDFNLAGLEVIKNTLFFMMDAMPINLLDTVIDVAEKELNKFVDHFENNYKIDLVTYMGEPYLVPVPRNQSGLELEQERELVIIDDRGEPENEDYGATQEGGDDLRPFKLNDVIFTDDDVISENEQRLDLC